MIAPKSDPERLGGSGDCAHCRDKRKRVGGGMNLGPAGLERSLANPSADSHFPLSNCSIPDSPLRSGSQPHSSSLALAPLWHPGLSDLRH